MSARGCRGEYAELPLELRSFYDTVRSLSPGFFASAQGGSSVAAALLAVAAGLAAPDQLCHVELIREGERHSEHSFEARAQGTELSFLFPQGALPPGRCNARVAGSSLSPVWTYEITIDPRSP